MNSSEFSIWNSIIETDCKIWNTNFALKMKNNLIICVILVGILKQFYHYGLVQAKVCEKVSSELFSIWWNLMEFDSKPLFFFWCFIFRPTFISLQKALSAQQILFWWRIKHARLHFWTKQNHYMASMFISKITLK